MALHTSLPIYKVAYDLLQTVLKLVGNMPRQFKRILGERICDLAQEVVVLIAEANIDTDKRPHLCVLLRQLRLLETLLRCCVDLRLISQGQYASAIALSSSVGKQANKWKGHYGPSPVA